MNTIDPREQGALQAAAAAEQLRRQFTQAMRGFASAVTVITVAHGGQRSGYTATSVSSFCAEPPTVLVSTKETSSSAALITGSGRFAVAGGRLFGGVVATGSIGFPVFAAYSAIALAQTAFATASF